LQPANRRDIFLGMLALAVFAALAFVRQAQERAAPSSVPSSYDTGRLGYRALYDLLGQQGFQVSRFEDHHQLLNASITTLVFATGEGAPDPQAFTRNDVIAIKRWTAAGGHLIVLSSRYDLGDAVLGLPASRSQQLMTVAHPVFPALLPGVRSVRGIFAGGFAYDAAPKAVPLLATHKNLVALRYRMGKGFVVAFTDAALFGNQRLALADNARLAYDLFAAAPGAIAFDEAIHGNIGGDSFWSVLPAPAHAAAYLLLVATLLAALGSAVRFAPPVELAPADERGSGDYISAMGRLLARAKAAGKAVRDDAEPVMRAVRRSVNAPADAPMKVVVERLKSGALQRSVRELHHLTQLDHPSDRELLRAGALCARLRKDFT